MPMKTACVIHNPTARHTMIMRKGVYGACGSGARAAHDAGELAGARTPGGGEGAGAGEGVTFNNRLEAPEKAEAPERVKGSAALRQEHVLKKNARNDYG